MRNRGNSRDYLLSRLHEQSPDLAAAVISGKLSVHAAAIAAGMVKKPNSLDQLIKAWAQATEEQKLQFLQQISEHALELGIQVQPITRQQFRRLSADDQLRVVLAGERRAQPRTASLNGDAKR